MHVPESALPMPLPSAARVSFALLTASDAPFILTLLNDPDFLRHIGDRHVRTLEAAERYIETGPRASYTAHGFGLLRVDIKHSGEPIGICGLLRRPSLAEADIGFALLPAYRGRGYAREAGRAVLAHARDVLGVERVVAILSADNAASARTLEAIGLRYAKRVRLAPTDEELLLYA